MSTIEQATNIPERQTIPANYLLENGSVMPADLIKELNPVQAGTPSAEFQTQLLQEVRKAELSREEGKAESINTEYAQLTDEQRAGFTDAQLISNDTLGKAIKEEETLDDLSVEEQCVLIKLQEVFRKAKDANPDKPVNLQLSDDVDQKVYNNLLNRMSIRMIKSGTDKTQVEQIATTEVVQTPEQTSNPDSPDRFNTFRVKIGETAPGLTWNEYSNTAAKEMKETGQLKWGQERIYFELPLNSLAQMRDLVLKVAGEIKIPIAFKLMDVEKTSPINYDETRFVTNFASVSDTRKFYSALTQDPAYSQLAPDRERDYHGYQLDQVATYANGFREQRSSLQAVVDTAQPNPDGTYTFTGTNGKRITIPESSYQLFSQQLNQLPDPKKAWEQA